MKRTTPLSAIKLKCKDCMAGSISEVKLCPVYDCSLYIYRLGKDPNRKRGPLSEEQKKTLRNNLLEASQKKANYQ